MWSLLKVAELIVIKGCTSLHETVGSPYTYLTDGARAHGEKGQQNFGLHNTIKRTELVRNDGQLLVVPSEVGAGPAILALQLVQQIKQGFITIGHVNWSSDEQDPVLTAGKLNHAFAQYKVRSLGYEYSLSRSTDPALSVCRAVSTKNTKHKMHVMLQIMLTTFPPQTTPSDPALREGVVWGRAEKARNVDAATIFTTPFLRIFYQHSWH